MRKKQASKLSCSESRDIIQYLDKDKPWHSITFAYMGEVIGGDLRPELSPWGAKEAVWHGLADLENIEVVPYLMPQVLKAFKQRC